MMDMGVPLLVNLFFKIILDPEKKTFFNIVYYEILVRVCLG